MSKLTTGALLLLSAAAVAQPAAPPHTPEWCDGYRAGWQEAAEAVWQNRNHNRALQKQPPETQQEAMARIHKSWPALPPGQVKQPDSLIERTINMMLDSIDLYVILPEGNLTPAGCNRN